MVPQYPVEPMPNYVDINAAIGMFFASPAAILIGVLLFIGGLNFFVRVWQSWFAKPRTFDPKKLPQVLDTLLVRKAAPLLVLGVLTWVTFDVTHAIAYVLYVVWAVATIGSELAQFFASFEAVTVKDDPAAVVGAS